MFPTLQQFETFIGTPNLSHSAIPLALIMLYCLALLQPRYQRRFAWLLVLSFFLVFTGYGMFMGLVTLAIFALEFYWRVVFPAQDLRDYPRFMVSRYVGTGLRLGYWGCSLVFVGETSVGELLSRLITLAFSRSIRARSFLTFEFVRNGCRR